MNEENLVQVKRISLLLNIHQYSLYVHCYFTYVATHVNFIDKIARFMTCLCEKKTKGHK